MFYKNCLIHLFYCCLFCSSYALSNTELIDRLSDLEESVKEIYARLESAEICLKKSTSRIEILEQKLNNYEKDSKKIEEKLESNPEIKQQISSKDIIDSCDNLIKQKKYKKAITNLEQFLLENKTDIYRGQACFFLGRAYDLSGKKNKALNAYLLCAKERPTGAKAPDALFLAANTYETIKGKNNLAICLYKKIVDNYENSRHFEEAKKALKRLKVNAK